MSWFYSVSSTYQLLTIHELIFGPPSALYNLYGRRVSLNNVRINQFCVDMVKAYSSGLQFREGFIFFQAKLCVFMTLTDAKIDHVPFSCASQVSFIKQSLSWKSVQRYFLYMLLVLTSIMFDVFSHIAFSQLCVNSFTCNFVSQGRAYTSASETSRAASQQAYPCLIPVCKSRFRHVLCNVCYTSFLICSSKLSLCTRFTLISVFSHLNLRSFYNLLFLFLSVHVLILKFLLFSWQISDLIEIRSAASEMKYVDGQTHSLHVFLMFALCTMNASHSTASDDIAVLKSLTNVDCPDSAP